MPCCLIPLPVSLQSDQESSSCTWTPLQPPLPPDSPRRLAPACLLLQSDQEKFQLYMDATGLDEIQYNLEVGAREGMPVGFQCVLVRMILEVSM